MKFVHIADIHFDAHFVILLINGFQNRWDNDFYLFTLVGCRLNRYPLTYMIIAPDPSASSDTAPPASSQYSPPSAGLCSSWGSICGWS